MAFGCRHTSLQGCFQSSAPTHSCRKVAHPAVFERTRQLYWLSRDQCPKQHSSNLVRSSSSPRLVLLQACVRTYRPRHRALVQCQQKQQVAASEVASVSNETYTEESGDEIKSSHDTPPKTKQATLLETWLQASFAFTMDIAAQQPNNMPCMLWSHLTCAVLCCMNECNCHTLCTCDGIAQLPCHPTQHDKDLQGLDNLMHACSTLHGQPALFVLIDQVHAPCFTLAVVHSATSAPAKLTWKPIAYLMCCLPSAVKAILVSWVLLLAHSLKSVLTQPTVQFTAFCPTSKAVPLVTSPDEPVVKACLSSQLRCGECC